MEKYTINMTELLSKDTFIDKVFNYEENKEWNFKGDIPAIIDFYADWCGPCKMLAPVLEELGKEYQDKVIIYKIDTEKERELSAMFGIKSIPSMLFCPIGEDPQMAHGALPKKQIEQIITDVLKVSK